MPTKVRIPVPLRKLTGEQSVVELSGNTIEEILKNLDTKYPGMRDRICDENGQIRRFINIFVDGEDIRFKDGIKTKVKEPAEVSIIPAIAGGVGKKALDLIFPQELIKEPVICQMSKAFDVVFNIRRAKITDKVGEMVVELEGNPDVIESAISWLKARKIKVEPVTHDAIES